MSRVPIRVRLAALVALAMMLVLAGVGLFVYLRVADDLDESLDTTLEARAAAVAASGRAAAGSPGDPEDGFALLLAADGRVLERTGGAEGPVLTRAELARAASDDVEAEREVDGVDGTTLNEMLDRLRGSYDRERRFVADASHELRTPVAVIKAELEGALRRAPADPDLRESLRAAVDECDRLAQLAEDLLVLARSGDGALAVRPAPLDPAELLEHVRTRFSARAAEHGRALRVDAEPGLILDADELRLSQALGNLVDNALRHGAGAITLSARRAGEEVELAVADEGAGPAPEVRPRAFERFARGDEARTRGGAGLGLAIVRAIAEAHGGAAELGDGARVVLRLPSQVGPSSRSYVGPMPTQGETT